MSADWHRSLVNPLDERGRGRDLIYRARQDGFTSVVNDGSPSKLTTLVEDELLRWIFTQQSDSSKSFWGMSGT